MGFGVRSLCPAKTTTMGLDGYEIVLGVEDRLGIRFDRKNGNPAVFETVGSLYEYVWARIGESAERTENSRGRRRLIKPGAESVEPLARSRALKRLTTSLPDDLLANVSPHGSSTNIETQDRASCDELDLATRLDRLVSPWSRRRDWSRWQEKAELRFPSLEHPSFVSRMLFCTPSVLGIKVGLWAGNRGGFGWGLTAGLVWWLFTFMALNTAAEKLLPPVFPKNCQTLGELTDRVVELNPSLDVAPDEWTPEWVWKELQEVLVNVLAVPPDQITPTARLVEDLGMN